MHKEARVDARTRRRNLERRRKKKAEADSKVERSETGYRGQQVITRNSFSYSPSKLKTMKIFSWSSVFGINMIRFREEWSAKVILQGTGAVAWRERYIAVVC